VESVAGGRVQGAGAAPGARPGGQAARDARRGVPREAAAANRSFLALLALRIEPAALPGWRTLGEPTVASARRPRHRALSDAGRLGAGGMWTARIGASPVVRQMCTSRGMCLVSQRRCWLGSSSWHPLCCSEYNSSMSRPLIRWAGSKRRSIPLLARLCPDQYGCYFEPFAGSAALFLHLSPSRACLSDANRELINTYRVLRRFPRRLYEAATARRPSKSHYEHLRSLNPRSLSPFDRAVRFLYLNRHCFNGLYRTNRDGQFNVPYSRSKTGAWPSYDVFGTTASRLRSAQLRTGDFDSCLAAVQRGDFCYLDPPYHLSARRSFVDYCSRGFERSDLDRLVRTLWRLDVGGAAVLLTYAHCPDLTRALKGWRSRKVLVSRSIAGFAGHRRMYREVAWYNY
jgi:DNA adenine methylase